MIICHWQEIIAVVAAKLTNPEKNTDVIDFAP